MKFYIGEHVIATPDHLRGLMNWVKMKIDPRNKRLKVVSGTIREITKNRVKLLLSNGREQWVYKDECQKER